MFSRAPFRSTFEDDVRIRCFGVCARSTYLRYSLPNLTSSRPPKLSFPTYATASSSCLTRNYSSPTGRYISNVRIGSLSSKMVSEPTSCPSLRFAAPWCEAGYYVSIVTYGDIGSALSYLAPILDPYPWLTMQTYAYSTHVSRTTITPSWKHIDLSWKHSLPHCRLHLPLVTIGLIYYSIPLLRPLNDTLDATAYTSYGSTYSKLPITITIATYTLPSYRDYTTSRPRSAPNDTCGYLLSSHVSCIDIPSTGKGITLPLMCPPNLRRSRRYSVSPGSTSTIMPSISTLVRVGLRKGVIGSHSAEVAPSFVIRIHSSMFLVGGLPLEGLHRLYSILTSISLCHPYLLSLLTSNSVSRPLYPFPLFPRIYLNLTPIPIVMMLLQNHTTLLYSLGMLTTSAYSSLADVRLAQTALRLPLTATIPFIYFH